MTHDPLLAGQPIPADRINKLDDQGSYIPALTSAGTNPTLGTGAVQNGWWHRNGHMIIGGAVIQFGTSGVNAGTNNYRISLPFAANLSVMATGGAGRSSSIGTANMFDNSAASTGWSTGIIYLRDASTVEIQTSTEGLVSAGTPWAPDSWAASDAISIGFAYLADPSGLP